MGPNFEICSWSMAWAQWYENTCPFQIFSLEEKSIPNWVLSTIAQEDVLSWCNPFIGYSLCASRPHIIMSMPTTSISPPPPSPSLSFMLMSPKLLFPLSSTATENEYKTINLRLSICEYYKRQSTIILCKTTKHELSLTLCFVRQWSFKYATDGCHQQQ